jgi:tetratricopeptide (TPR) repeat protein
MKISFFRFVVWLFLPSLTTLGQHSQIDSLQQALSKTVATNQRMEILHLLAKKTFGKDPKLSIGYSDQLLTLAEQLDDQEKLMLGYQDRGIAQGFNNDYQAAISSLLRSSELAEKLKNFVMAGENYTNIGSAYYVIFGYYDKAIEYYLKALSAYENANDKKGVASALSGIGMCYSNEKKFDEALANLNRSLGIMEELGDEKEIAKVLVSIGGVYDHLNDFPKALSYHRRAYGLFEKLKITRGMARSLYSMADILMQQRDWTNAINYVTRAVSLDQQTNHKASLAEDLNLLGTIYRNKGDNLMAEKTLLQAVTLSVPLKKKESLSRAYELLADIYAEKKDFKNAYEYQRLHTLYYDSVFNAEKSKQIAEMQTRFDSERKQQEIQKLTEEKFINQVMIGIFAGFIILILLIAFLVINRQKLKIRSDRQIAEKESQIMEERKALYETELRNNQLKHENLQTQLEFKNKELASHTLNLIRKSEILDNVKECAEEIKSAPENLMRQKLASLISLVNYSFNSDREWDTFKIHFEQVHQNFFTKLLDQYPDLTSNDLKLCALIKMNLDNRGIAMILNISQESAKVARHRLRKKLNVPSEENLVAYLNIQG